MGFVFSLVARQIREATERGDDVLLTGTIMGGGPCSWAANDHLRAGYRVYATPGAAKSFNDVLPLTGVVLTKADGDARGGAALSVRRVTGKPIKFLGVGEKTDALEPFYPDRMASRILGMGDVLSLVEQAQRTVDQEHAQKLAQKISKGKGFDLEDFRDQLLQMEQMGGMASLVDKLPGLGKMPDAEQLSQGEKQMRRTVATSAPRSKR